MHTFIHTIIHISIYWCADYCTQLIFTTMSYLALAWHSFVKETSNIRHYYLTVYSTWPLALSTELKHKRILLTELSIFIINKLSNISKYQQNTNKYQQIQLKKSKRMKTARLPLLINLKENHDSDLMWLLTKWGLVIPILPPDKERPSRII